MDGRTFENLPEGKKQAILSAGILCFGRNGYEKTSIAEIAKEAGISKASVFHYFGTKNDLFIYLVNYTRNEVNNIFVEGTDDYFETLTLYAKAYFQIIKKHSGMLEFIRVVNELVAKKSLDTLTELSKDYSQVNDETIFAKVNWNKFSGSHEHHVIKNITTWVANSCLMDLDRNLSVEALTAETSKYLDILKNSMYKPEYL